MTSSRDTLEELKLKTDSMLDVVQAFDCLHLNDSPIVHRAIKPVSKVMDRVVTLDLEDAKDIGKGLSSGATRISYARNVSEDGSGEGEPFRLAERDFEYIGENEEVTAEKNLFGSEVKYVEVGDEYLFQGNTKRPRQVSWLL